MNEFYYQNTKQKKEKLSLPLRVAKTITGRRQNPFLHFVGNNFIILTFDGKTSCVSLEDFSTLWQIPKVGWVSCGKSKLFFTESVNDQVEMFDISSGKWIKSVTSETVLGHYVIDHQFVLDVGGDQEGVYMFVDKYDLDNKLEKLWRFQIEDESSNRFLMSENKLILNGNYGFYCLDWETGKLVWELPIDGWINTYEQLVWQDLVIIPMGPTTKAFDIHTGKLRWEQTVKGFTQGTIYKDKLYLIHNKHYGIVDLTIGKVELEKDISDIYKPFGVTAEAVLQYGVAITETQAIFATSIGVLFILDKWTGEVLWHYKENGIINVKPLVYDHRVYFTKTYNEKTSLVVLEEY